MTQSMNESLVKAICDVDKLAIIQSTMVKAKSPLQIVKETRVPQTSCYRKIDQLEKEGLIVKVGFKLNKIRHKEWFYKTITERISLHITTSNVIVSIQ